MTFQRQNDAHVDTAKQIKTQETAVLKTQVKSTN